MKTSTFHGLLKRSLIWLLLPALLVVKPVAQANIVFEYDYSFDGGFFSGANSSRRAVFEAAGNSISSRLGDTFTAITPGGGNSWDIEFTNPGTGGFQSISNPTIAANTIRFYAGGHNLSGSALGQGGPGGFSGSGNDAFFDNILSRGEPGITDGFGFDLMTQTDFAPWGGSIEFDSSATWHFNPLTDPANGVNDFFSVALHEIAHVLGMGTAISWESLINGFGEFTGPSSFTLNGGNNVPLHGDLGHWAEDTMSMLPLGGLQEVAMDPDLTVGDKKFFTNMDYAGLDDIGWEIIPIPEPSSALLALAGCGAVAFTRKRQRRG